MEVREKLKAIFENESMAFVPEPAEVPAPEALTEVTVNDEFLCGLLQWAGVEENAACQLIEAMLEKAQGGTLTAEALNEILCGNQADCATEEPEEISMEIPVVVIP
jgi:hypothetical protein